MEKDQKKTFVLSDESVNTQGFRVLLSGGDLRQFKRNPVMYYNHDEWSMPIGLWENIRVEDGKLMADAVFDMEDENGKKVAGKVERGFLRMASMGIRPLEWSDDPKVMLPGQTRPTVTKWLLRESSIVGIGSNHSALRMYDENDKIMTDDKILKLFDKPAVQAIARPQTKKVMNKEVLEILKLSDKASDEEALAAVKKLVDENAALKTENDLFKKEKKELADKVAGMENAAAEARKKEAEQLVDNAIKEGKLNDSARKQTLEFFDANFDAAKEMLEGIPGYKSIKEQLEGADKTELQRLSDKTWDELDKSGELQTLKDKYPDEYEKKFKEKFPK